MPMDEVEFLEWKKRTLELRVAFELRERDRRRAETEAEEIRLDSARAELARAKAAVCEQIRVLGIKPN
jgi:hypothetical protein